MIPTKRLLLILSSFAISVSASLAADTPKPQWIWHPNGGNAATNGEVRFFRKSFPLEGKVQKAVLAVAADNSAEVFLNEKMAMNARGYERATYTDVTTQLVSGENLLSIRGLNENGPGGLLVRLEITLANKEKQFVVSDTTWITGADADRTTVRKFEWKDSGSWVAAKNVQAEGGSAWGDVFKPAQATPADQIAVLPGFKIELLHSSQPS